MALRAKPHLSYSQYSLFQKCPLQYYYRYVKKLRRPPTAPLTQGSSIDQAVNFNSREKMRQGYDEPVSVLQDVYATEFRARIDETIFEDEKPDKLMLEGDKLIKTYRREAAPAIEPIDVQRKYLIGFDNRPYNFLGFADLVSTYDQDEKIVLDIKTAKRAYAADAVHSSGQGLFYTACELAMGNPLPRFGLVVLLKSDSRLQFQETQFSESDCARAWRDIDRVWKTIEFMKETGAWTAAPREVAARPNWVCSEKWCGYWHRCKKEF